MTLGTLSIENVEKWKKKREGKGVGWVGLGWARWSSVVL